MKAGSIKNWDIYNETIETSTTPVLNIILFLLYSSGKVLLSKNVIKNNKNATLHFSKISVPPLYVRLWYVNSDVIKGIAIIEFQNGVSIWLI